MTNEHPGWPPQSTGSGMMLRLVAGLGRPGRTRRASLMLLGFLAFLALFVVVVVVAS